MAHRTRKWKKYQAAVYEMEAKLRREPRPDDLVGDFLKNKRRSPFWDYFEKDQGNGYRKYLLEQARSLLSHLRVLYVIDGERVPVKEYHRVIVDRKAPTHLRGGYAHNHAVVRNAGLRLQMTEQAVQVLESWKDRFKAFEEVRDVYPIIDKAISVLQRVKFARRAARRKAASR